MQLTAGLTWEQASNRWPSALNPILANPLNLTTVLKQVSLVTGVNVLNHLLGRQMQGWFITDINQPVTIYRSANMSALTLTLTASGPCIVNIGVY